MSYTRVIPRDLFNESSLLKCYGRIYINLEFANSHDAELLHDGSAFEVEQDDDSGAISITNVSLRVRGAAYALYRPLNSRETWPLYLLNGDTEIEVFNGDGSFSADMLVFLRGS